MLVRDDFFGVSEDVVGVGGAEIALSAADFRLDGDGYAYLAAFGDDLSLEDLPLVELEDMIAN